MSKFFNDLPPILEPFNPEGIPEEWHRGETFDEEGLRHSFDDLPIKIQAKPNIRNGFTDDGDWQEVYEFRWYKHGKISRAGNKPPVIRIIENSYSTLDEKMNFHSYNGMPASFLIVEDDKSFSLDWFDTGIIHRDGDLPLSIVVDAKGNIEFEAYGLHGVPHRGNSLPAEVEPDWQVWLVQGVMHNSEGYAEFTHPDSYIWALYGLKVSEKIFKRIKMTRNKTNMPAWVAFLFVLKIISQEHLDGFMNSNGIWDTEVPASWLLNCWNVTEEFYENQISFLAEHGNISIFDSDPDESLFASFLAVIKSDEDGILLRAAQGKENDA